MWRRLSGYWILSKIVLVSADPKAQVSVLGLPFFAADRQHQFPLPACVTVFAQIDSLPGAQRESAVCDWDRQAIA